jgi:hypothetical protein
MLKPEHLTAMEEFIESRTRFVTAAKQNLCNDSKLSLINILGDRPLLH